MSEGEGVAGLGAQKPESPEAGCGRMPNAEELKHILAKHRGWLQQDGHAALEEYDTYLERVEPAYPEWEAEALASPEQADLCKAHLYSANLTGAHLEKADLTGANLYSANLSGAHLEGANLSGASLEKADLSGANLSEANLSRANLGSAVAQHLNQRVANKVHFYST